MSLRSFTVTVRTALGRATYTALAASSCAAWDSACAAQGDTPCGITVLPARTA